MESLSPKQTRAYVLDLMKRYDLHARKSIGQHFMIDDSVLDRIVDACDLTKETAVVEIGAGIGNLTTRLAADAGRVISIEMDESFRPLHDKMDAAYEGLTFHYGDAMDFEWNAPPFDPPATDLVIAGNIPYQITSPLIMDLLRSPAPWRSVVFMIQQEVARRVCAEPGTKIYGALSLKSWMLCDRDYLFDVSARSFLPPPRVESAVIRLTRKAIQPLSDHASRMRFYKLADALFARRRKQSPNSLAEAGAFGMGRDEWTEILKQAHLDPQRRGETFTLEEVLRLLKTTDEARA